ncbi:MAG: glycosyltransferase family 87 protein [Cyclobacteriaceae bacterium]
MKVKNPLLIRLNSLPAEYGGVLLLVFYSILAFTNTIIPKNITDFTKAYYAGGKAVWHGNYEALSRLIEQALFTNIPIVAMVLSPFAVFDSWTAGRIFTVLMILATAGAYVLLARRYCPNHRLLLLGLFLINGPLWYCLQLGNTTNAILFLFIVALLLWDQGKDYPAGLLIGVCLVIKPFLMLIGLYFLLRRQWGVVLGAASVGISAAALSVAFFGLQMNLDWYEHCIAAFGGRPMAAFNVQSIGGFLMRLQTGRNFLWDWSPRDLTPALKFLHSAILLSLIGTTFWLIFKKRAPQPTPPTTGLTPHDYLGFSMVLTLSLISSTVSWTHYYLLLFIPWALYLGGRLPLVDDKITRYLVWGSIICSSMLLIEPHMSFGWWPRQIARTVVSIHLFGGLLFLLALARAAVQTQKVSLAKKPFLEQSK